MKVEWKQPRPISIWAPKQTLKGAPPAAQLEKVLIPGINEVDDKVWAYAKKHPGLQHYIDEGELVEVERPSPDRKKSNKGLLAYDVKEAKRLIKQTYDKDLLSEWKAADNRNGIVGEIDRQIEKINASARPKTDEEKNESRYSNG